MIGGYPDPAQRFQAMTALSLTFAALVLVLGLTAWHALMRWLPADLEGRIVLGAALASFKQVFIDDARNSCWWHRSPRPACVICSSVSSRAFAAMKLRHKAGFVATRACCGFLLPPSSARWWASGTIEWDS